MLPISQVLFRFKKAICYSLSGTVWRFSGETPIIYVLLLLKTRMPEHFNSDELDVYIYDIIDDLKKGYRYDENFDVLVGSAGAIIHLLNVFEVTRDEELLILAHDLFSHLEKNSTKITVEGQDGRAWKGTMASNPLAGLHTESQELCGHCQNLVDTSQKIKRLKL